MPPFMMGTTSSITIQRAPAVGAKMWCFFCLFFCFYRQDAAKRQTAVIVFTHRPEIRFFAPQGRLVAPIQVKLCSTDGHSGPLGCAKFHVNRCRRVGMRPPKYQKFSLFGKKSPRRGESLDRFPRCENVVFVVVVFLSRSESGAPCVRGVHSSNTHCVALAIYRPISAWFAFFFGRDCSLRHAT